MTGRSAFDQRAWIPAGGGLGLLLAGWIAARLAAAHLGGGQAVLQRQILLVGWPMWAILLASFAVIVWAGAMGADRPRRWLGFAMVADAVGVMLLIVAADSGLLGLVPALQLYLIIGAWLACWTALTGLLGRLGAGTAVVASSALAAALLAAPVLIMPLLRALPPPVRPQAVGIMTDLCPVFGMLEALRPAVLFAWHQTPVMYQLTAVGQDVPVALPAWWISPVICGAVAVVAAGVDGWLGE